MKILITGGAGFIGSNLANKAAEEGHAVIVYDNLSTGYKENLDGLDLNLVEADIRDRNTLSKCLEGVECVFHLAANVGNVRSIENPYYDSEVNMLGTTILLEEMVRYSVPQIVYSSTAAGYGEPVNLPIGEEHPMNPDSPYGVSKISAEKLVLCFSKLYGIHAACLRYFNAYGINQRYDAYGNVIPIFAARIKERKPLVIYGDGEQTRDFINVKDIVNANWLAFRQQSSGYYNIATGKPTSINQLVSAMEEALQSKLERHYQPFRKGEVKHSRADINKAKEALGFEPAVPLEEGIREYLKWCNIK